MDRNANVIARRFLARKRGANMVEYIILVGMVALICVVMFGEFGGAVKRKVENQRDTVGSGINHDAK
ncbi:MAG: hypothetical protein KF795_07225 [Labilithrix sp.]|nr:hypothetical protein [Labilithrix sp.]